MPQARGSIPPQGESEFYETYTLQRYNDTVKHVFSHPIRRLALLLLSSLIVGLLIPGGTSSQSNLDLVLLTLKIMWLFPIPLLALYYFGALTLKSTDLTIDPTRLASNHEKFAPSRVLYTIVTRGTNLDSVERSVSSVLYWTNRVSTDYGLALIHEVWIVTEEDAYSKLRNRYDKIATDDVRLLVVPADYRTKNGTQFKARALQYAAEYRQRNGFDGANDWVYHQDDETAIGEDTVLGNLEFILDSEGQRTYGAGIILYPIAMRNNVPSAAEFWRPSLLDTLYLTSLKKASNSTPGQHGSHLLTRADVENKVGWDFGPNSLTEDSIYATHVLNENPKASGIMKGFAYEQPPFTVSDLLKQRRRWVLGDLMILGRKDAHIREKLPMIGGLIVWYSTLPVILGVGLGLLHIGGGMFLGDGFVLGLLAYSVYDIYGVGYGLHSPYILNRSTSLVGKTKLAVNCLLAMIIDSLAPWFAIARRTKMYEVIEKDAVKTEP